MSSSCLLPVSAIAPPRLLKRPRSASDDRLSLEQILKACKRSNPASPHSPVGATATSSAMEKESVSSAVPAALSPLLQACSSMRSAIPFLQNSRRHALSLLLQNECERALLVLEKIERANDMISRQRRRFVLDQANAIHKSSIDQQQQQQEEAVVADRKKQARKVCFRDEVVVVDVDVIDRSPAPMPPLIREEILVLRASRPIPLGNFSELWN